MTDKTMTLEQVRDRLVQYAAYMQTGGYDGKFLGPRDVSQCADAITRHLSQPAERGDEKPLAFCRVEDVYDNDSMLRQMGVKRGDLLYTAPPPAGGVPDDVRKRLQYACDLMAERKYGSDARSPGHNARLVIERVLSDTPSTTIDVASVREVMGELAEWGKKWPSLDAQRKKLARAIGDAK